MQMLEHIAELEGAAETLPGGREAATVRTKLQEARLAEMERLRVSGRADLDDGRAMLETVGHALGHGRFNAAAIAGEAVPTGSSRSSGVQRS
jgi:hypothetical protein